MNVNTIFLKTGFVLMLGGLLCAGPTAWAVENSTRAQITYQIGEGVYVNAGSDDGLNRGTAGSLVFNAGKVVTFTVLQVSRNSALLQLEPIEPDLTGKSVELLFNAQEKPEPDPEKPASATVSPEPFIPLLQPMKSVAAPSAAATVHHGRVGIRQQFQMGSDGQDYAVTRLSTAGSVERIEGSAWSFTWLGQARYRTGDGYATHAEYETLQPILYKAMLQHPLDQGGFVRLGRFLPEQLPGVGYLDGAQLEVTRDGPWRFGLLGGFKPGLNDLTVSADQPTGGGYATLETGARSGAYYSGTAGLIGSLFEGEANRLALLMNQYASYGSKYHLRSSAELDFGIADTTNSATQLSRFDLTVSARLNSTHTLRAGADHWQRPDTLAQRDLLAIVTDEIFDAGYWRYWVGAQHKLPWKLRLNEEVSWVVSDASEDAARWRVGLFRNGLFQWRRAGISTSVYNLKSAGADGMGSVVSAYFPAFKDRVTVRPSTGLRWLDVDGAGDKLSLTYFALQLDGRITSNWTLSGGFTATRGDGSDSTLLDCGVRYRW